MKPWLKKTITVVVTLLVLVITYFVLAAFLPRWWAQRIAGLAEGGFSRGIMWGLLFGILCTAIPLILIVWVWQVRGWKYGRGVQIALTVLALVVAIPNLMTLSVVLGGGNAAHAGERIMDVDAPGFRGASLVGAIIGVLVFVLLVVAVARYRKRGKDLRAARADLERKAAEAESRESDSADDARAAEGLPPEDSASGPAGR
jgi:MFS family permease